MRAVCPDCRGAGHRRTPLLFTLLTLGVAKLIDESSFPETCRRCGGCGRISRPIDERRSRGGE